MLGCCVSADLFVFMFRFCVAVLVFVLVTYSLVGWFLVGFGMFVGCYLFWFRSNVVGCLMWVFSCLLDLTCIMVCTLWCYCCIVGVL